MLENTDLPVPYAGPVVNGAMQEPVRCDVVAHGHRVGEVAQQGGDGAVAQYGIDGRDGENGDVRHGDEGRQSENGYQLLLRTALIRA